MEWVNDRRILDRFVVGLVLFCFVLFVVLGFFFTAPSCQIEVNFFYDLDFSSPDVKLLFKPRVYS